MGSISGMNYAVVKTYSGWENKTAGEILKLRKEYGEKSPEYNEIKNCLRCKGCYDRWLKIYKCEPNEGQLPVLTHVDRCNSGGTHFRLRVGATHEVKSCYYNDPYEFIREQSDTYRDVEMGERGRARLTILNLLNPRSSPKDIKGKAGKTNRLNSQKRFGFLQEVYDRYNDDWIILPIETEEGKKVKIDDLIVSPLQAKRKVQEKEKSICIVMGTVLKVLNQNSGGYINIRFEDDRQYPYFQLSVKPNHIYNEEDLKCLVNRKIACYGEARCNKGYPQMELLSIDRQIVFMDIKESKPRPVVIPQIKIDRVQEKIMNTMGATETDLDVNNFTYYNNKQNDIHHLEKQIILYENQKEQKVHNYRQIKHLMEGISREKEDLSQQLEDGHSNQKVIGSKLETKKQKIREKLFKLIGRNHSKEVQELIQEKERIDKEIKQLEQNIISIEQRFTELLSEENKVQQSIKELNQNIKNTQDEVVQLRQGLKWEEEWKQNIGTENVYIYRKLLSNQPKDLLIAVQIVQSLDTADLNINYFTQQHWKNEPTKLYSNTKKGLTISIHPMDVYVYDTLENNLKYALNKLLPTDTDKRSSLSSKKESILQN
ncbi:hypothetical protein [Peribacillus frigoritolerans]|uniref:hypothetical protein n=1 Tax=Peribacillus frigoritolerans TaxID=450367 RepID=UPI002E1FB19F|nr:hypothetical protein [Peribacillus frigoritolerans]